MKTFLFVQKQEDPGCDYNLGCGVKVSILRANSEEEALDKALGLPSNWQNKAIEASSSGGSLLGWISDNVIAGTPLGLLEGEFRLESAKLYEVVREVDMMPIMADKLGEIRKFEKEFNAVENEKKERAEYERLKKKFG